MDTYTQNKILHHEDCPARSLYPWKSSESSLLFKNVDLSVVTMKGINAFANKQWTLVLWPRLNSLSLANQIEFLDMFWWFDRRIKKNPVFPRIVNQLFEGWVTCRQEIPRESWGEKKRRMKGFLSLIRSERFARHVKAWTTEIFWIFVYTQLVTHAYNPWTD